MVLEVFHGRGQASRSYENTFFRFFASYISKHFEIKNREGMLFGHPGSTELKYLHADCILVTNQAIFIFDFKEFDELTVTLPSEEEFVSGPWKTDQVNSITGELATVAGGAAQNPYDQLNKKDKWLRDALRKLGIESKLPIITCVVFNGEVTIDGKIPGRLKNKFFIATKTDFLEVIEDNLNTKPRYRLSGAELSKIAELFIVEPYNELIPMDITDFQTLSDLKKATETQAAKIDDREQEIKLLRAELKKSSRKTNSINTKAEQEFKLELEKALSQRARDQNKLEKLQKQLESQSKETQQRYTLALAEAEKAKSNAEIEKQRTEQRKLAYKNRIFMYVVVIVVFFVALFTIVAGVLRKEHIEAQELHEKMLNGEVCIPVSQVADFIEAKGICVEYTINHIGESKQYIFLNDKSFGSFTGLIKNKQVLSFADAKSQLLYKKVRIRGNITQYDSTAQIEVNNLTQIEIIAP